MTDEHVNDHLDEYLDDLLAAADREAVEQHLRTCGVCQGDVQELRKMRSALAGLPRSIRPGRDLWPGIAARLTPRGHRSAPDAPARPGRPPARWYLRAAAVVLVIATGAASFYLSTHPPGGGWRVQALEGLPRIDGGSVAVAGEIHPGEWLETDSASRAVIAIGVIGHVDVGPSTRLRIAAAGANDHRLALSVGTIKASISAPPRVFFVETPSALATDLGCEYRLHVAENGSGVLLVTAGWVELSFAGRTSIIPSGMMCATRSGFGPGTPYDEHAGERFRTALLRYDFERGGRAALDTVLALARAADAVTLWHLLPRSSGADRASVYDRLTTLAAPPEQVTRDGVLAGDPAMLRAWQARLGLDYRRWWNFWQ